MITQQWSVQTHKDDVDRSYINVTDLQLSELVFGALYESHQIFGDDPAKQQPQFIAAYPTFKLMGKAIEDESSFKPLLNATTMRTAAERVFGGIVAHLAQQKLLNPTTTNGTGDSTFSEYRLHVQIAALWTMVATLILMTGFSILLVVIIVRDVLPADPSLITTLGTILASSDSMQQLLSGTGGSRLSEIKEKLQHNSFHTFFSVEFNFQVSADDPKSMVVDNTKHKKRNKKEKRIPKCKPMWMPLAFRKISIAAILVLPCLLIGILELLYQLSNQRQGLFPVTSDKSANSYAVRYISTLVMVLVSTLFNSVDFIIATFAPFSALRSGPTSALRTLHQSMIGALPPVALYKALRMKQYGAAASNTASTIGSILTIIVSGLWILDDNILVATPATATLANPWNINWNASSDGGAANLLNSIQHGSATPSNTVFADLVFPRIANVAEAQNEKPILANDTYSYEFTVPALHPVLSCNIVPHERMLFTSYSEMTHAGLVRATIVTVTVERLEGCNLDTNNSSNIFGFNTTWGGVSGGDLNAWGGNLVDLRLGYARAEEPESGPELVTAAYDGRPYPPDGCPSTGAIFGYFRGNTTDPKHVTAITCRQRIQEIMVKVSYAQDLSIDHSKPPPTWGSEAATYLTNGTQRLDSFMYHVVPNLFGSFTPFSWSRDSTMGDGSAPDASDAFFNQLIWGPNGTSHADLLGPENAQNLVDAVSNLYKNYMLEAIDRNFRGNTSASVNEQGDTNPSSNSVLQGTVFQPAMPRLRMASGSKITLQVLLGTMVLLMAFVYWHVDVRGTLPRNPWPIASTMALLVDSELLKHDLSTLGNGRKRAGRNHGAPDLDCSLGWWGKDNRDRNQSGGFRNVEAKRIILPSDPEFDRVSLDSLIIDEIPNDGTPTDRLRPSERSNEDVSSWRTPTMVDRSLGEEISANETLGEERFSEVPLDQEATITTGGLLTENEVTEDTPRDGLQGSETTDEHLPASKALKRKTVVTETLNEEITSRFGIDIGVPRAFGYSAGKARRRGWPWKTDDTYTLL